MTDNQERGIGGGVEGGVGNPVCSEAFLADDRNKIWEALQTIAEILESLEKTQRSSNFGQKIQGDTIKICLNVMLDLKERLEKLEKKDERNLLHLGH